MKFNYGNLGRPLSTHFLAFVLGMATLSTRSARADAPTAVPTAPLPAMVTPATVVPSVTAPGAEAPDTVVDTATTPLRTAEDIAPDGSSGAKLADAREQQAAATAPLSLADAIAMTLRNNPQREAAIATLQAALARVGIAKSAGGPSVALSGSTSHDRYYGGGTTTGNNGVTTGGGTGNTTNTFSVATSSNSESAAIDVSLPIYSGGGVKANKRSAQASARSQAALTLQVEQQLVENTITAYLDVSRNEQLLQVAESNLDVSRERRRIAGERFRVGSGARLDVLSANTDLSTARQSRIQASNDLAQSKSTLNVLLGRAPETPLKLLEVTALTPRIPLTVDASEATGAEGDNSNSTGITTTNVSAQLRDLAQKSNPALASNRAQIEAALADIDTAKAARKPSVSLSLSNLLTNPVQSAGRFLLSLGLSASQTLFDSGKASSQISEAQALAEEANANLKTQQLSVASDIDTQLLTLDSAQEQLSSANEAVLEAREALVAAQAGYAAGARTRLEVSDSQTALLTTQTTAANARFDLANAQARLSTTVGVLTQEGQDAYAQALNEQEQQELAKVQAEKQAEPSRKKGRTPKK